MTSQQQAWATRLREAWKRDGTYPNGASATDSQWLAAASLIESLVGSIRQLAQNGLTEHFVLSEIQPLIDALAAIVDATTPQ